MVVVRREGPAHSGHISMYEEWWVERVGREESPNTSLGFSRGPTRQATLKKSLFPIQRVAIIVASWEAAKSV